MPIIAQDSVNMAHKYLEKLRLLCGEDCKAPFEINSINFGSSFAPRSSVSVKEGRGDASPAESDFEEDFQSL